MRTTAHAGAGGRRTRMIVLLAAIAVGLAVVFLVGQRPASAHDHLLPKTALVEGEERLQAGRLVKESSWTYADGEGGLTTDTAYYYWRFPDVVRVAAGAEMRIKIFVDRQREPFVLAAYPRIDEKGRPDGEKRLLSASLEPVVRDGLTVAWDAVFDLKRPESPLLPRGQGTLAGRGGLWRAAVRPLGLPREDQGRPLGRVGGHGGARVRVGGRHGDGSGRSANTLE